MSTELGGLIPKAQDLAISFFLGEGETIPQFHLRYFQTTYEIILLQDKIGQIKSLIGKYVMERSKLKHLQQYMTTFELNYGIFERLSQSGQLSTTLTPTIEEVFETIFK